MCWPAAGVLEALVDEKLVGEESPGQQQRRRRRRAAKDAPDATSHQIAERLEGQARAIKQQIALVRVQLTRALTPLCGQLLSFCACG